MILYCSLVNVSVGKMFVGGVFPGIMLAFMFIVYIGVRSALQPGLAPPIPPEERVGLRGKVVSLKSVILPVLLIMGVMGSLFAGITTPTEAAAIGCAGAFITAMVKRSFSWSLVKDSVHTTVRLVGIVAWIIVSAYIFNIAFSYIGGRDLVSSWVTGLDVAPLVVILIMQLSLFLMGMILDDVAIMFLTVPIFLPVVAGLGFSPLWFGVLLMVNLQMAYLTPPFGGQLFIMKAIAPKEVTMAHIYRSVIPFVIIQGIAVVIIMFFPQIVLWLPTKLFG
jgi:tripartite ATP-independent transporter DctM subunit